DRRRATRRADRPALLQHPLARASQRAQAGPRIVSVGSVRALITGGGGQLASDLQALLGDSARSFSHAELDIADAAAVDRAFAEVGPDVVFNCAAFHNVDVCETEPDSAWAVNVRAVRDLATRGARLVHFSTNYVFDGRREQPYGEDDLPAPRSIYALTK